MNTTSRVEPCTRCRLAYVPLMTVIALAIGACHWEPESGTTPDSAIGVPGTAAVLKFMPEATAVAVAVPSVDRAEEQIRALLVRGAPEGVDMEAELKVVTSQLARSANAFEAASLADIAAIKGIDPEKPLAVFFGTPDPANTAPPPSDHRTFERDVLRYVGIQTVAPSVAVLPYAKRQAAEELVVEWGGSGSMTPKDLTEPKTTLFTNESGDFAYFFTDAYLVAGNSPGLVQGVADRMKSPTAIRYGTPECPADSANEIVVLARADKLTPESIPSAAPSAGSHIPRNATDAMSQLGQQWMTAYKGDDPIVVTLHFAKDQLTVRSRLDYAKHPDAQKSLSPPVPMKHLDMLPKSTLGVWTVQLTPQTRANLKEMAVKSTSAEGGMVGQMGDSFGKVVDAMGDEATIAMTGPGSDMSKVAALIEFQDGEAARALMKELGLNLLKVETYNNTDVYSFVFPPVSFNYALPKNTFVLSGNLDTVKSLIDAAGSGTGGGFAGALNPPLDTKHPRQQAFVGKRELFTDALLPALEGYGTVTTDQAKYSVNAFEKVHDARLTTDVNNNWQDTRLIVTFE